MRACPEKGSLVAKRLVWLPLPRAGEGWGEGFLHFGTRSEERETNSDRTILSANMPPQPIHMVRAMTGWEIPATGPGALENRSVLGKKRRFRWRLARGLAALLLFASLAIAGTFPLVMHAGTHLPQGVEQSASVPLLNLWTIWWNVDRLRHAYDDYWNAPIYRPTPGMLAFNEPQTVVGWLAWPLWHILPRPAYVYNILIITFLTLNGWISYMLLRRLRLTWFTSLAGGAMVCLLPLIHWQLGIFQLISVWGIAWTLLALERLRRRPGPGQAIHVAVALACTYSLCCYYGLFLAILLPAAIPFLWGRALLRKRVWLWSIVSAAVAALLLCPIVVPQLIITSRHPFDYPEQWIRSLSVLPRDYWQTPVEQLLSLPKLARDPQRYPWALSPGTLKALVAIGAVACSIWSRRRRRWVLGLTALAVAAMALSMGPNLHWRGISLYRLLCAVVPGFAHARNIFRFAIFFQLAVALLAALGLNGLYVLVRKRVRNRMGRMVLLAATVGLACLLTAEVWPRRPALYATPINLAHGNWVSWLYRPDQRQACLAYFPLPATVWAPSFQHTTEWMYCQMWHARPMINGYSTFTPEPFEQAQPQLREFPSLQAITALNQLGATHCVIDRQAGMLADPQLLTSLGLECVLDDKATGIQIWRLPMHVPPETRTTTSD